MSETTGTTDTNIAVLEHESEILADVIEYSEEDQAERIQKELAKYTKKRSKKRKWIILAAALVLAFVGYKIFAPKPAPPPLDTVSLERQKLSNTISLTGTIESAEATKVYAKAGGMVNAVNVKVGDRVTAGDVLSTLNTEDLTLSIAQQKASMDKQSKLNQHSLENAQKKLENTETNIDKGLDANLISAQNSLKRAEQDLNSARLDYNDVKDTHTDADDDLDEADRKLRRAINDREDAKKALANETDPIKKPALEEKLKETEDVLAKANSVYNNALQDKSALSRERLAYHNARVTYENALANKNATENSVKQELTDYEDNITQAELSADETENQIALKQLEKKLLDSTIIAPISGTVTAVYLKEGEPASAAAPAFVVENTDELVVKTKVKEFDITTVKTGMAATIKSDATGDEMFDGKVGQISPTAEKTADGSVQTSGKVEFATDVDLVSRDTGLRVGMNVRLNVIVAEKEDVFAVPFDAVATNAEGKQILYIAKANAEGQMIATAVPVTTGLETSFHIEVTGDTLSEGDTVISSPIGIVEGAVVTLVPKLAGAVGAGGTGDTGGAAVSVTVAG